MKFSDRDGWVSNEVGIDLVSICGSYSLIGGIPQGRGNSIISKTFQGLKIHNRVWVKFSIFLIDQIRNSDYTLRVSLDNEVTVRNVIINPSEQNNSECGTDRT